MDRYFALDLKNDENLIAEYEKHHEQIWSEIAEMMKKSGIVEMEIFRLGNRLIMKMQTDDKIFSEENYSKIQKENKRNQEWENLMNKYQQATPWSVTGQKWTPMKKIFQLSSQ